MGYDSAVDSKEKTGAPEREIEVTPEMIRAGAQELSMFNSEFESYEKGAENIFLVMLDVA